MPVEVAPSRIELSNLLGGYAPDPEEGSLPLDHSPDVLNLLPDRSSGALELRKGFARLTNGRANIQGYWVRHLNYYELVDGGAWKRYLVAVLTDGQDNVANNVQVWVYDLKNSTFARVDTVDRAWKKGDVEHWYAVVEGTYYGGARADVIYSWHPTNGWNADPTTPNVKTWVDDINGAVDPATQFARDFAFKKGQKVKLGTKFYATTRSIRFKTWETDQQYSKGEKVSRKATIGGSQYWRSFECVQKHTSDATNRPGDGGGSPADYWKKVRLRNIKDEDNEMTPDWVFMPLPGKGSVGAYHGFRLWVRHDDSDNWARLQYSAPAKPERDTDIADLDFRPKDWAPVDDIDGGGGGWLTVPFPKGDAVRALHSFGNYLIIAGKWHTFALSGTNENTWNLRSVGEYGAVSTHCIAELEGLVYLLGPGGQLVVTDGTSMREVPGMEKVREWLKDRLDQLLVGEDTFNWQPSLRAYAGKLWMALPDEDGTGYTLVYDPPTQSFWLLDTPVLSITSGMAKRAMRLYFSTMVNGGASQRPCLFGYKDDPGNEVYTDDDWEATSATPATGDITWRHRTAWFQFGTTRNERRLRRLWALVTGETGEQVVVDTLRNFEEGSAHATATRTLVGTAQAEFIEGSVSTTDLYSVGVKLAGTSNAQTAVHGYGIDTEPRRTRFHRG